MSTPPRALGKILKLISDTAPKDRDRVGAGRDPRNGSGMDPLARARARAGQMGGWSHGGDWDGSTGSSASNQLSVVVNVRNIYTQLGLHGEYNVLLLFIIYLLLYGEITATYCENHKKRRQQHTYNVKFRRIRITLLVVGKQKILHILIVCL